MKGFLTVFYTRPAKTVYIILIFLLSYFVGEHQMRYYEYYLSDKQSFINAISQIDSFNYETSYYFKNTVKSTVDAVVKLTMEYPEVFDGEKNEDELMKHFESIGDRAFLHDIGMLRSVKGLRFAVVNHSEGKVYSSIREINGADSGADVRKHFGENGENLLIARSCRNPYFATNSFIEFAEDIRECASEYTDNFDLYISFGSMEDYNAAAEACRQLHFEMREKIEKLNDRIAIHVALIAVLTLVLLVVTGKQEPGGKTYLTTINRIPNDLLAVIYALVLYCIFALYRTSTSVILNYGMELESIWFMGSENFYMSRIKYCVIIFICIIVNLLCVLKRAYKTGTLLSNTYAYPAISNFMKRFGKEKGTEDAEKDEKS